MDHILAWKYVEQIALSAKQYQYSVDKSIKKIIFILPNMIFLHHLTRKHTIYIPKVAFLCRRATFKRMTFLLSFVNNALSTRCKSTLVQYWLSFFLRFFVRSDGNIFYRRQQKKFRDDFFSPSTRVIHRYWQNERLLFLSAKLSINHRSLIKKTVHAEIERHAVLFLYLLSISVTMLFLI